MLPAPPWIMMRGVMGPDLGYGSEGGMVDVLTEAER